MSHIILYTCTFLLNPLLCIFHSNSLRYRKSLSIVYPDWVAPDRRMLQFRTNKGPQNRSLSNGSTRSERHKTDPVHAEQQHMYMQVITSSGTVVYTGISEGTTGQQKAALGKTQIGTSRYATTTQKGEHRTTTSKYTEQSGFLITWPTNCQACFELQKFLKFLKSYCVLFHRQTHTHTCTQNAVWRDDNLFRTEQDWFQTWIRLGYRTGGVSLAPMMYGTGQ